MKKQYLFILAGIGAILAGSALLASSPKVSDEMSRSYWNFKRYGSGPGISVQNFAGCQMKAMMETKTDEQFSKEWEEASKREHFDAIDVDRYMTTYCPPSTPEGTTKFWTEYYKDKDYPDMDEERQTQVLIEKSIKLSEYKRKFLNREFTALKDEPKE